MKKLFLSLCRLCYAAIVLIDAYVLLYAEKFAHWFQRLTGYTSFFLAKIGVIMWGVSLLVTIMNNLHPLWPPTDGESHGWAVFYSLILGAAVFRGVLLDKADERLHQGHTVLPAWVMLHRTPFSPIARVMLLTLAVIMTPIAIFVATTANAWWFLRLLSNMSSWGLTIFEYFVAVNPLPPGTSKVRQWLTNAFEMRVPVPVKE